MRTRENLSAYVSARGCMRCVLVRYACGRLHDPAGSRLWGRVQRASIGSKQTGIYVCTCANLSGSPSLAYATEGPGSWVHNPYYSPLANDHLRILETQTNGHTDTHHTSNPRIRAASHNTYASARTHIIMDARTHTRSRGHTHTHTHTEMHPHTNTCTRTCTPTVQPEWQLRLQTKELLRRQPGVWRRSVCTYVRLSRQTMANVSRGS